MGDCLRAGKLSYHVTSHQANSAYHPSGVGNEYIAGKAKAGMARSDCRRMCGCVGKTPRSLENACHTWVLLRWHFTRRHDIKCTYFTFTFYLHSPSATNYCGMRGWTDDIIKCAKFQLTWFWNNMWPKIVFSTGLNVSIITLPWDYINLNNTARNMTNQIMSAK